MRLIFEQIRAGGDRNFGYLLADRDAKQGVLIDPSYSPDVFVERAADQGIAITHVLNTHSHPDHVNGNDVARERTGAPLSAYERAPTRPGVPLADLQELHVGSLRLQILHVPGHCPDHVVIFEPAYRLLVTGDLLFVGKVGGTRTEADARTEWDSLQRVLEAIPHDATVWPGHDYGARPSSTLALELETNPFLRCAGIDAFLQLKSDWPAVKARLGLR
ncbi:MAG: MBL fold hydrolase [Acidobacteria bacterium RIFCSPLOWO2_02_FULL_68_18]|nr:MAG: MBL fold hydrolase [Acidobacteria bacterium RIFCSPLOWO2_02_FULL_68_18]OFW51734.1 MAG: MBL fold hydrolase [Acidobacteria bacterium RIFCSPLOWO2_12_FULL_68_19]